MSDETITVTAKPSDFWRLGYMISDLDKITEARNEHTLQIGKFIHVSGALKEVILSLIEEDRKQVIEELTAGTPIDKPA